MTSTDPARGAGAWKVAHVDRNQGCSSKMSSFQAISCPSRSFCAAVDNAGYVFTSTRPAVGAAGWSAAQISRPNDLTAISCPSAALCVAVNYNGEAIVSTNPTGGAGAWHATTIDSGLCTGPHPCRSIGRLGERQLDAISCPAVSLCVAGDWEGNVITSTDPAGRSNAWKIAYVDDDSTSGPAGGPNPAPAKVEFSYMPLNGAEWTPAITDRGAELRAISCPSTLLCVAVDKAGNAILGEAKAPTRGVGVRERPRSTDAVYKLGGSS